MKRFKDKKILLALCGGIAAYKAYDLIRELQRQGASCVQVLLTEGAKQFVSPLTLETLSQQPVLDNAFCNVEHKTPMHIWLAQEFDAMLVMPATANTIGKLAQGIADDLLSTTAITFTNKPLLIAPAMNCRMWLNPLVIENTNKLRSFENITVIDPEIGDLACGEFGEGKLVSQNLLLDYLYQATHPYKNIYQSKKVLLTAGGTSEPIDSVRYITNRSSGKMGLGLADELWAMGADVTLVHTLDELNEKPYTTIRVKTVDEMSAICHEYFPKIDGCIKSAAVSDFKAEAIVDDKIKKSEHYSLELVQSQDILKSLGSLKQPEQFLVGFAAESGEISEEKLNNKLNGKNLDLLVCNDISRADIGFAAEQNEVALYFKNGEHVKLPKADKQMIAQQILVKLAEENFKLVFGATDSQDKLVSSDGQLDILKVVHSE